MRPARARGQRRRIEEASQSFGCWVYYNTYNCDEGLPGAALGLTWAGGAGGVGTRTTHCPLTFRWKGTWARGFMGSGRQGSGGRGCLFGGFVGATSDFVEECHDEELHAQQNEVILGFMPPIPGHGRGLGT